MDPARLLAAYETAKADLLAERGAHGHWEGELATSALATATAVSALALVEKHGVGKHGADDDATPVAATTAGADGVRRRIADGVRYLATHQNADGGWGDTEKSYSNISTTMLAVAAFHLAGRADQHATMLEKARRYIDQRGGIPGLRRRYGKDKTFAVPILTNYALAGLAPWSEVAPLPFEMACLPQSFYRFVRLPVVSYAIPALVAIGQARYFHRKPWNPVMRAVRSASVSKSLAVLRRMQPASGGYLEAVPLTSFVVMSLASTGRALHPVACDGVKFLIDSVRPDGSWPIDSNLATWVTTLSIIGLAAAEPDVVRLLAGDGSDRLLDWLLRCQHRERHPFTGAAPGGWGWSDLSGAVPDADDTPGALLSLAEWRRSPLCTDDQRRRIDAAALQGIDWLLGLQNRDGGWPTFCRGWGTLPFDRSGADLTAHAIRALHAWRTAADVAAQGPAQGANDAQRIERAIERGFAYLAKQQRADGSWLPLWFGNQSYPDDENPVYGTTKVLLAYRDVGRFGSPVAQRAVAWLLSDQNSDGGWGRSSGNAEEVRSSVEETSLAVEALLTEEGEGATSGERSRSIADALQTSLAQGLDWLMTSVETRRHRESSPIGFYFAKLWYYEKLYPLTFIVSALGRACRRYGARHGSPAETSPSKISP